MSKKNMEQIESKDFNEGDTLKKRIAISYKNTNWGIANVVVRFENEIFPPTKSLNHRYISVEAEYAGKKYNTRSSKGEVNGALNEMKLHIERKLL